MEGFKISLAAARKNAGMTQSEVAKVLNKNVATIINWETGKTKDIPATCMVELCHLYKIPQEYILLPNSSSLT